MSLAFAYHEPYYWMVFLPIVVVLYQLTPKRYRWLILLCSSYLFFFCWSRYLVLYNIITTGITFVFGRILSNMVKVPKDVDKKAFIAKRKRILFYGIMLNLLVLGVLKYTNFFTGIVYSLMRKEFTPFNIAVPIGISYYTLQCISYLCDVKNGKIQAAKHLHKLALYTSFFPTIMEGPITRYKDVSKDLYAGHDVTMNNLAWGFQRIVMGLFKKILIADHMAAGIKVIFESYRFSGAMSFLCAVMCTMQLYMDFAGTIDIAIGSGKIFGITIAENFRQPFFAKNASEFWRRWHITLGSFLRDYVFYPVSLSKPVQKITKWTKTHMGKTCARYVGPMIALFCVWMCNGLWHGPKWTYIFYGFYYFFFIFVELLLEKPVKDFNEKHNLNEEGWGWRIFRFIKLFIIVVIGEMIFCARSLKEGLYMTVSILTRFDISVLKQNIFEIGMRPHDYLIPLIGILIILVIDIFKERGVNVQEKFNQMKTWQRWGILYILIFAIVLFGAYGPGYDAIAMLYAGF